MIIAFIDDEEVKDISWYSNMHMIILLYTTESLGTVKDL